MIKIYLIPIIRYGVIFFMKKKMDNINDRYLCLKIHCNCFVSICYLLVLDKNYTCMNTLLPTNVQWILWIYYIICLVHVYMFSLCNLLWISDLIVSSLDEVKLTAILNKHWMLAYCYHFDVKVKLYKKSNDKLMIKTSGKLLFKLHCMISR